MRNLKIRLTKGFFALLALAYANIVSAQIDTKDAVDKATGELEALKPLLEIICGLGIVGVLIYGGWKWQSDNADKPKLIGTIVAVIVVLGLAFWAIDQTL